MKVTWLKRALRWLVIGAVLFFLGQTLRAHWQEVLALDVSQWRGSWLGLSFLLTLAAHGWTGWVWGWILATLGQPVSGRWSTAIYLQTNIAKYLPGNVWHLYGRVRAAQGQGASWAIATLSVLMEALLLVASGLIVALRATPQAGGGVQWLGLAAVLVSLHPRALNPLLRLAGRWSGTAPEAVERVQRYPARPLLGEVVFLIGRSLGFLATVHALTPLTAGQLLPLTSAYSLAWLSGMVIPGAPGGLGVFEAIALRLLAGNLDMGVLLGAIAVYRLINTVAEVAGAGLGRGMQQWADRRARSR